MATVAPVTLAQVISPNIHVSAGACPQRENEPSIATLGQNTVAAWFHEFDEHVCTAISRNGGLSWEPAAIPPLNPAYEAGYGYPTVCIDGEGTAFCALYGGAQEGDVSGQTVFIYRGSFDDPEWQWQRIARAIPYVPNSQLIDGVKILCDQATGTLYLVYTHFLLYFEGRIEFVRSTDGGETWSTATTLSGVSCNTAQLAIGPDGELYVVWMDYTLRAIIGRKSTDQGVSFGPEFQVSPTQENLGIGPSGWSYSWPHAPAYRYMECMDFAAFLGLAVDTSPGPRRGALYVTWTEHGLGTADEQPTRVVPEVEPHLNFATATPIEIGDDAYGSMQSADLPPYQGDCDLFTFEGTAGTTIRITGEVTECHPVLGCRPGSFSLLLLCGSDTTRLVQVGCGEVAAPESVPTMIYTLPTTGRYYLFTGCSASRSISYVFKLRKYEIAPTEVARDHRDVMMVSSMDGGTMWSGKVRVNDDAPMHDNSIPAIAVDSQGLVHMAWYDRRESECGAEVHTYWTWSANGGVTFQPSRRVSEMPSEGGRFEDFFRRNLWHVGDHMTLHAEGNRVHLLWTQVPMGGGPGEIYQVIITDVPTGIAVGRFEAQPEEERVVVRWWVGDEHGVTGFRVHRATDASEEFAPVAMVPVSGRNEYRWEDGAVVVGQRYRYRLEIVRARGPSGWEGPVEATIEIRPTALRWRDVVPNPFDDVVELALETAAPAATRVRVFDVTGHLVTELRPEVLGADTRVRWDGRNQSGRWVAPGVYLVRADAQGRHVTRRVIRMR